MKHLKHILPLILMSIVLSACTMESSDNGDLDGLWQLTAKEDLTTGDVSDPRNLQATWAFQGTLVQLNAISIPNHIIGTFTHTDDLLTIDQLNTFAHGQGDTPVTDVSFIDVVGLSQLTETFRVVRLSSDDMQLESSRYRLTFRKY